MRTTYVRRKHATPCHNKAEGYLRLDWNPIEPASNMQSFVQSRYCVYDPTYT